MCAPCALPASSRPVKRTGLITLSAPAWWASSSLSAARITTLIGTCGARCRTVSTIRIEAVVAPGRDQHGARLVDPHRHQVLVARGVGLDHVAAELLGGGEPLGVGVHHHDAVRIGAARDQLGDRLGARDAEAEHDDVVGELFLDAGHAPFLPTALDDVSIGRADEDEEHQRRGSA